MYHRLKQVHEKIFKGEPHSNGIITHIIPVARQVKKKKTETSFGSSSWWIGTKGYRLSDNIGPWDHDVLKTSCPSDNIQAMNSTCDPFKIICMCLWQNIFKLI